MVNSDSHVISAAARPQRIVRRQIPRKRPVVDVDPILEIRVYALFLRSEKKSNNDSKTTCSVVSLLSPDS
jgi:hypothetical protein